MSQSRPRVLIITYYWPPSGGGGVQRWLKFAKYLPSLGWEPVVFAPDNADYPLVDDSLVAETDGIEVVRFPIREVRRLYKRFAKSGSKSTSKENDADNLFYKARSDLSWKQKLALYVRSNAFIPDARSLWIRPSVTFLKDWIPNNNIDAIITTGPPHSCHMIGLHLKKAMHLPWIADFRDPWTEIEFYDKLTLSKWADSRHRELEKAVVRTADALTTVSPSWGQLFQSKGATDVTVITNGFDTEDFGGILPSDEPEIEPDIICHAGTFARDRNPVVLWDSLNAFKQVKFKLKLLGSTDPFIIQDLEAHNIDTKDLGYVSHDTAIAEMRKSGILLILQNAAVEQNVKGRIPGKIFEYMATGRPILFVGDTTSDLAQILEPLKHAVACSFNKEEIAVALNRLSGLVNSREKPGDEIAIYSRKNLTSKLVELLNNISANTR